MADVAAKSDIVGFTIENTKFPLQRAPQGALNFQRRVAVEICRNFASARLAFGPLVILLYCSSASRGHVDLHAVLHVVCAVGLGNIKLCADCGLQVVADPVGDGDSQETVLSDFGL